MLATGNAAHTYGKPTMAITHIDSVEITVVEARNLIAGDRFTKNDPYVKIRSGLHDKSTKVQSGTNPVFNEVVKIEASHLSDKLVFEVYDKDPGRDDLLGKFELPLDELRRSGNMDRWFTLADKHGKMGNNGELHLILRPRGHN
ncbi:C2 domain-containing protein [Catenaria anguillulae PL171]|uniref:C2 domain-containing protein n=1 Tax=Catenaria anguillulae PL171 TaxID=765915 RepID=A0A1Y2HNH7_9FUNG|nr:C2 domain-containing protein [Catenaria anguillulae PL171]